MSPCYILATKFDDLDLQKRRKQGEEWYKLVKEINHDKYS